MSRETRVRCDLCKREILPGRDPYIQIAVVMRTADVCSVECAKAWLEQEIAESQIPLPLAPTGHPA